MNKKILINSIKPFVSRFSGQRIKHISCFTNNLQSRSYQNTIFSFSKKNLAQNEINKAFKNYRNEEDAEEYEKNPLINFLFSELKKINENTFNIDEYCVGLGSLENIRINANEMKANHAEIAYMFENLINSIISKGKLNKQNIDNFLPLNYKVMNMYGIDSRNLRTILKRLCMNYSNDLGK